jgi:hypothetical protein
MWSELSAAHQDLVSEPFSLSFLHNHFEAPSYSFSTAVLITGLGPILNALVERLQWTNPVIIWDLTILLGEDDNLQDEYIWAWQEKVQQIIKENGIKLNVWNMWLSKEILLLLLWTLSYTFKS